MEFGEIWVKFICRIIFNKYHVLVHSDQDIFTKSGNKKVIIINIRAISYLTDLPGA